MKIRLYKPVSIFLMRIWGNNRELWESELGKWAGFKIDLPKYFWEIHLFMIHQKVPRYLTLVCKPANNWFSVFYSYNLNGDLKKYMETVIVKKCRRIRAEAMLKKIRKAG